MVSTDRREALRTEAEHERETEALRAEVEAARPKVAALDALRLSIRVAHGGGEDVSLVDAVRDLGGDRLAVNGARAQMEAARRARDARTDCGAAESCGECVACLRRQLDAALVQAGKLEAEIAHIKAKRATDQAEAAKAREEVVRLDKEIGAALVARQAAIAACRADLERPASMESRATRSLAWAVLLALDPAAARAEPEEAPEPRDLTTIGRDALVWAREMFGPDVADDPTERAARVLEEAAELAQAEGVDEGTALRIVERTFSRPAGERDHEGAQVAVTLAAWAARRGVDLVSAADAEVTRIRALDPEAVRAKHADKARAGIAARPTTEPEAKPTIDPGEGWRLLLDGEVIKEGDEVLLLCGWCLTSDAGQRCGIDDEGMTLHRRRRIASSAPRRVLPPPLDPAERMRAARARVEAEHAAELDRLRAGRIE